MTATAPSPAPSPTATENLIREYVAAWVARWRMSGTLATAFEAGGRSAEPGARFAIDAIDLVTASRGEIDAKHTYLDWQAGLTQMGL